MTREAYHREMRRLENELQTLANMVQEAIQRSVELVERDDLDGSSQLVRYDRTVNERRYSIESEVLTVIATQSPVARDMRELAAIIEIAGELERIGDYAKGIANIHHKLGGVSISPKALRIMHEMASVAATMIARSLDAFERRDAELAARVIADDDKVDEHFNTIFKIVVAGESIEGHVGDRAIECANYVLWMAHNLERTADRTINICERVLFTITGLLPVHDSA